MAYSDNDINQVGERYVAKPIIRNIAGTADTVTIADVDAFLICNNASAVTVTLPLASSVAFPIGTVITVFSNGAGGVTIAKTGSDTLTGTATAAQNAVRRVIKTAQTAAGVSAWYAYV